MPVTTHTHTHTHTHTSILKPFEGSEPTGLKVNIAFISFDVDMLQKVSVCVWWSSDNVEILFFSSHP